MPIPALEAYKVQINEDITTQSAPDSIPPDVVGSGYTDLVDIITPYLEFDENRVFSAGSAVPDDLDGADGDIYFQGETDGTITLWQKSAGSWVNNGSFVIGNGGVTVTGTTASDGTFVATLGTNRLVSVYEGDNLVYPNYNKATKTLSAMNESAAFTAYFI